MSTLHPQDLMLSEIVCADKASSAGLLIYQLHRQAHANRALALMFPVTEALLGAGFSTAVHRYLQHCPMSDADGAAWSAGFATWLDTQVELQEFVYIAEMAQLEWLCWTLQHAADPQLDFDSLALLTHYEPDALKLVIHPLCVSVRSRFPLAAIWQYHQAESEPQRLADISQSLQAPTYSEHILLTRPQFKTELTVLTNAQDEIFSLCQAQASLKEVLDALARQQIEFSSWLAFMLKTGAFSGFSLRQPLTSIEVS